jgi:hypothetical protein
MMALGMMLGFLLGVVVSSGMPKEHVQAWVSDFFDPYWLAFLGIGVMLFMWIGG